MWVVVPPHAADQVALVGVSPADMLTYVAVSAGLILVALFARWPPARRAAAVDQVEGLRAD